MNQNVDSTLRELEIQEELMRLKADHINVLKKMLTASKELEKLNSSLAGTIGLDLPSSISEVVGSKRKAPPSSKSKKHKSKSSSSKRQKRMKAISIVTVKPVKVINPKTGQRITVGGEAGNGKRNRAFKNIVKAAHKSGWKRGSPERGHVVDVVAQCQRKGLTHFDESWIPQDVQAEARKKNGLTPEQLAQLSSDAVSSGSSDDDIEPHKLEEFHGLFNKYCLKMNDPKFFGNGKTMHDDLATAEKVLTKWLTNIRSKSPYNGKPFKMYMEYSMIQGRGAIVDSKGFLVASEEEDCVTINSASNGKEINTVTPLAKASRHVAKCLSNIRENYDNMKEEGSGWVWIRSVSMVVSLNRVFPMVPVAGESGEKRIEKLVDKESAVAERAAHVAAAEKEKCPEDEGESTHTGGKWLDIPKWLKEVTVLGEPDAFPVFNPKPKPTSPEANMCFSWCVLAALHPKDVNGKYERHLEIYNQTADKLRWARGYISMGNVAYLFHAIEDGDLHHVRLPEGIGYPVPLDEEVFNQIEELNPSVSISVFCLGRGKGEITPFYASRRRLEPGRTHVRLGVVQAHKPIRIPKSAVGYLDTNSYEHHFVLLDRFDDIMRVAYTAVGAKGSVGWAKCKVKKNGKKRSGIHYCDNCLNRFQRRRGQHGLEGHMEACIFNKPTQLVLPSPEKRFLQFKQFKYLVKHPFVIYADFEAVNVPVKDQTADLEALNMARHDISNHEVCGWAYYISVEDEYKPLFSDFQGYLGMPFTQIRSYVGKGAMERFWRALGTDVEYIRSIVCGPKGNQPPDWEDGDPAYEKIYREATHCGMCKQKFAPLDDEGEELPTTLYFLKRVMDHDHLTGKFRCVAHGGCNTAATLSKNYKVPIFFHNGKGYDFYHLVRSAATVSDVLGHCDLEVIAKSTQTFTSVSVNKKMRFADTLQFMQGSLDTLVRNAWNGNGAKWNDQTTKVFEPVTTWGYYSLAEGGSTNYVKKGVYPYELARSVEDLYAYTELPAKEQFDSKLRGSGISDGEYRRAQWAWKTFSCQNLADFTQRYCELDVLLLASVFDAFRRAAIDPSGYRLDPAHFLTAPSMAQSAMLLRNLEQNFVIECFSEANVGIDGYRMAKQGIRGGFCQVMHPFAEGTPYDVSDFAAGLVEATELDQKVLYIDCNNLYGTAMLKPLPYGGYRWIKKPGQLYKPSDWVSAALEKVVQQQDGNCVWAGQDGSAFELARNSIVMQGDDMAAIAEVIRNHPEDSKYGYLLCVDVEYPESLHDLHNDLPFLPEKKAPPDPSPYTRQQFAAAGASAAAASFRCQKLILDLNDKERYVVHYEMLKLALAHGLKLKAVHHVMEFKQAPFLKPYIEYNTEKRKLAKNAVDKDLYKLLNNAVFGKQMEDVESRRSIHLLTRTGWARAVKWGCHPWLASWSAVIPDELMVMEKKRQKVVLDKPIIVGQAILDLSKVIMYKAYYEKLVPQFNNDPANPRMTLKYGDTDSFQLHLQGKPGQSVLRDLYELQRDHDFFDLSEIQSPETNQFLNTVWEEGKPTLFASRNDNAKRLGCFKDEMKGVFIKQLICLRPKMYSLELWGELVTKHHNVKKAAMGKKEKVSEICRKKGIPMRVNIAHQQYRDTYFGAEVQKVGFVKIGRTKDLALRTLQEYKVGISGNDDKSFWFDASTVMRYGHSFIKEWKNQMCLMLEEDPTLHPEWDASSLKDDMQQAEDRIKRLAIQDLAQWVRDDSAVQSMLTTTEEAPAAEMQADLGKAAETEALIEEYLMSDDLPVAESE